MDDKIKVREGDSLIIELPGKKMITIVAGKEPSMDVRMVILSPRNSTSLRLRPDDVIEMSSILITPTNLLVRWRGLKIGLYAMLNMFEHVRSSYMSTNVVKQIACFGLAQKAMAMELGDGEPNNYFGEE